MVNLKKKLKTPKHLWYKASITHHNHIGTLGIVQDCLNGLGDNGMERQRFLQSCLGPYLLMQRDMSFSGNLVHRILLRELYHDGPNDEMRFMFGRHAVRFSKVEYCLISGLRFGDMPDTNMYPTLETGIHQRYFQGSNSVKLPELTDVVTLGHFQQPYDAVKLCLLLVLNKFIHGVDERYDVPVWQFCLVEDLDAFDAFPWGSYLYGHTIFNFINALDGRRNRFEKRQQEKGEEVHQQETYNLYGFAYALQIFAFEVIPLMAERFTNATENPALPRILKYNFSCRPREDKLNAILKPMMYALDQMDPTPNEIALPYYSGIYEVGNLLSLQGIALHQQPPEEERDEGTDNQSISPRHQRAARQSKQRSVEDVGPNVGPSSSTVETTRLSSSRADQTPTSSRAGPRQRVIAFDDDVHGSDVGSPIVSPASQSQPSLHSVPARDVSPPVVQRDTEGVVTRAEMEIALRNLQTSIEASMEQQFQNLLGVIRESTRIRDRQLAEIMFLIREVGESSKGGDFTDTRNTFDEADAEHEDDYTDPSSRDPVPLVFNVKDPLQDSGTSQGIRVMVDSPSTSHPSSSNIEFACMDASFTDTAPSFVVPSSSATTPILLSSQRIPSPIVPTIPLLTWKVGDTSTSPSVSPSTSVLKKWGPSTVMHDTNLGEPSDDNEDLRISRRPLSPVSVVTPIPKRVRYTSTTLRSTLRTQIRIGPNSRVAYTRMSSKRRGGLIQGFWRTTRRSYEMETERKNH